MMENRERFLKDITIHCPPEDLAHPALGTLRLVIFRREHEDNVKLDRVSPATWKCNRKIKLELGMGEIMFTLLAESAEGLGHVKLAEGDIEPLIAVTAQDVGQMKRNFEPADPTFPSLRMEFTVGTESALPNLGTDLEQHDKSVGHEGNMDMALNFGANNSKDPQYLARRGDQFFRRFEETRKEEDIDTAISAYELVVGTMSTDDKRYGAYNSNVGLARLRRFEVFGNIRDINQAISRLKTAVSFTPDGHTDLPSQLSTLGASFHSRSKRTGDLADIKSGIYNEQRAVELTPLGNVNLPSRLSNLGISFQSCFGRTRDITDIDSAIANFQRAVELTVPGHANLPSWLNNLGTSFESRFELSEDLIDIQSAISNFQRAVELAPQDHADLPTWLNNFGTSLASRFEWTGVLADIESAISNQQRAVKLTPPGHANLPSWLSNLGNSFVYRFGHTGDRVDIENAISNQQRAIKLTPSGHANLSSWHNNLGASFAFRFKNTRDLADIENAIFNFQRTIELTPLDHANLPSLLNNLGNSFESRFECSGDIADLEHAISVQQRAVELTAPNHADLPSRLGNLGKSFEARFKRTGDLADIDNAISNFESAVKLTPPGRANLPPRLNNLGVSFNSRFLRTEKLADIESAISNLQRAIELTPPGHADLPSRLNGLAQSQMYRSLHTRNLEQIDESISVYRSSATQITGPPSVRLRGAKAWAELSSLFGRSDTLEAFGVAIELLSHVAGLEQTVQKRHSNLIDTSELTTSAAATAIKAGQLNTALEWLEQGRCLVWNQIRCLHTPVDDLRAYDPMLADRFVNIANALEASRSRPMTSSKLSEETMAQMMAVQGEIQRRIESANEWTQLLEEIRALPDFQDFLRPRKAQSLLSGLPHDGAVVIFNINEKQCDALALVSGANAPLHISSLNFSKQQAIRLRDSLRAYLKMQGVRMREADRKGGPVPFEKEHILEELLQKVLRELWEHVAKPVLDALGYNSPRHSNRPRVWWCPTGPLTHLPIHAAGIYASNKNHAGPCVSDFVTSSYIPTVSALIERIKTAPQTSNKTLTHLLLVSQPSTPGLSDIPAVRAETRALKQMSEKNNIVAALLEDAAATAARVTEEMNAYSWVHFACHGIQDPEPLKSGLHLHDGRLELLEMMKRRIPDADHAFLSACQTGTGDEQLADEAVHIAAGMLAVGYRGVVATMWSISDAHGPEIAEGFYQHLLNAGSAEAGEQRLDSTCAAYALDHSIQKIRQKLGDGERALLTWVPYVHFGI